MRRNATNWARAGEFVARSRRFSPALHATFTPVANTRQAERVIAIVEQSKSTIGDSWRMHHNLQAHRALDVRRRVVLSRRLDAARDVLPYAFVSYAFVDCISLRATNHVVRNYSKYP